MSIKVEIDREDRFVHVTCQGSVMIDDLMAYQQSVWISGNVMGYDGLFDARQGDFSQVRSTDLMPFSMNAARIEQFTPKSKLAIVITSDEQKVLAEFYKASVNMLSINTRETQIFDSLEKALCWLGREKLNVSD